MKELVNEKFRGDSVHEYFDRLFTTDCTYSNPEILGNTLRVCVKNLVLMEGHPLRLPSSSALLYISESCFIFEGVSSSVRTLTPYIGNPKLGNFGDRYVEEHGPFETNSGLREYAFEGRIEQPYAWVDWVVAAQSFCLKLLKQ